MYKKAYTIASAQQEEDILIYQKNMDRVKDKLKTN